MTQAARERERERADEIYQKVRQWQEEKLASLRREMEMAMAERTREEEERKREEEKMAEHRARLKAKVLHPETTCIDNYYNYH